MINALIVALAPVFIIAFYIYFRDKYEKEPWQLLLKALLVGIVIALPVTFAEMGMQLVAFAPGSLLAAFWHAFMVAALCEEGFKWLALFLLIWNNKNFNDKFDGIVYATFISLGFAGIENVLYVYNYGIITGISRAFTAVPAHALFGVSMGFFFGLARFYTAKRKKYLWFSFAVPFLLHGIYNFILMAGNTYLLLLFIPFIVYMWINGFKMMKKLSNQSIFRNDLDIGIDFSKVNEYKPEHEN